jgi:hypothetical protein
MELNTVEDVRYIFFMMEHFVLVVIFILDPNQSDHESKIDTTILIRGFLEINAADFEIWKKVLGPSIARL